MITNWTQDQWYGFIGFAISGLAALALIAMAVHERRRRREHDEVDRLLASWRAEPVHVWTTPARVLPTRPYVLRPVGALHHYDQPAMPLDVIEHIAPGPGSLASLAAAGEGSLTRVELHDAEVVQWMAELFDRPAHVPLRDEAQEVDEGGLLTRFHAAIEPAMRKARLWEIQGRGVAGVSSARMALDHWRIESPTGEYPLLLAAAIGA